MTQPVRTEGPRRNPAITAARRQPRRQEPHLLQSDDGQPKPNEGLSAPLIHVARRKFSSKASQTPSTSKSHSKAQLDFAELGVFRACRSGGHLVLVNPASSRRSPYSRQKSWAQGGAGIRQPGSRIGGLHMQVMKRFNLYSRMSVHVTCRPFKSPAVGWTLPRSLWYS